MPPPRSRRPPRRLGQGTAARRRKASARPTKRRRCSRPAAPARPGAPRSGRSGRVPAARLWLNPRTRAFLAGQRAGGACRGWVRRAQPGNRVRTNATAGLGRGPDCGTRRRKRTRMTGLNDQLRASATISPTRSRSAKQNQKWERWAEEAHLRARARGHLRRPHKTLLEQPRVYSSHRRALERRPAALRQARHQPAGRRHHPIDRDPHRGLCARRLRPEARPPQQRGLLYPQGPRPRRP